MARTTTFRLPHSSDLRADLVAGATVALVSVPQGLAYAAMAGLPPAYGLSTAVVPAIVAALAGRSVTVVTGPTNASSLLLLGVVLPFVGTAGLEPGALQWIATLTLLCGVLRLIVVLGGASVLVRFLPESVLTGFIVGAGILIATMQLDEALGLPPVRATGAWDEIQGLFAVLSAGERPSLIAIVVACASTVAVAVGQRVSPRLPVAMVMVAGGAFVAWMFQLDASSGLPLVGDRADVPSGWPPGAMPVLDPAVIRRLLVPAGAIVLLGTLEMIVTVRAEDPRAEVRQEIMAQGLANVAGAFASAFPASTSLTRSTLLRMSHPSSRAAAVIAALLVVPVLLFASAMIAFIPQASLSGVLFMIATTMVKRPTLPRMWKAAGPSRLLMGVTLVSTLTLPLEWAVFVGAGLSLLIHLKKTSEPRVRSLTFRDERLVPVEDGVSPQVIVLEVSGAVHYAAVESLLEQAERQLSPAVRLAILDLSHAHELRFTGLRVLESWAGDLARRGVQLRLAGVTPELHDLLRSVQSHLEYTMWDPEPGRSAWNSFRRFGSTP